MSKAHETPKQWMHILKGPYPGMKKCKQGDKKEKL